jgi:ElaB/YqjD/DUF883 family membrane-anchored ribosome-binding protein
MFSHRDYSGARSANIREIDRRLKSLERSLERAGTQVATRAVGTAEHLTETLASALGGLADKFRGLSIADEAAKFGGDAAKLGNDALRRLSREVEHRPLVTLTVAVGVGILAGLVILRR